MSRRWIILAAVGLAACHSSTEPLGGGAFLRFSGATSAADTIEARIPQALLVDVRDSSGAVPPAGTVVRFTSVVPPLLPSYRAEALVAELTSAYYNAFATATTDDAGRAAVLIQLGIVAGTARVVVSVPTLGLEDTARFTVNPGKAFRMQVTPADTALTVGKSFTLGGGIVDRWSNPRTDPVTWSSSAPGLTVTNTGLVTGTAVGRHRIIATGSAGTDTGEVSVVPPGRFAAFSGYYGPTTITTFDADGSNLTTLATANNGGIGIHPAWIPGTSTVVYTTVVAGYQTLYTVAPGGVPTPFFAATPATVTHQAEPTPSADGKWLYFSAYDTRCSAYAYCVSRAKIDGSAPELLVATPSRSPAPSPDGSKVAYMVGEGGSTIRVFDVATRTTSTWSVNGYSPAWSPDGTQIAYVAPSGALSFVNPDGTGARTFSPAVSTGAPLAWSPDSKWVVGNWSYTSRLIDAATGATLPLAYTANKHFVASVK